MIAADALARGLDSPTLRELAGLSKTADVREIADIFAGALEELGIEIPDEDAVRWERVRSWAGRMTQGVVSAYEGASRITDEYYRLGEPEHLQEMYILTVSWGADSPDRRDALEAFMLKAAGDLLRDLPHRSS